jgi:[ribosomal protein S18]-alanine N-acetyltransferase
MPDSTHIRPATHADIPALIDLEQKVATAAHWSRAQYEAMFTESSPQRSALVIEANRVVQGFLISRAIGAEWEIENIVVAGQARRIGLAARLMGKFLDQARAGKAKSVFLEVRESNRAARALYEKSGFVENGRRRLYYASPPEDAVLYHLPFV